MRKCRMLINRSIMLDGNILGFNADGSKKMFVLPDNEATKFENLGYLEIIDTKPEVSLGDLANVDDALLVGLQEIGCNTLEDVKAIGEAELTSVNGIGPVKASKLYAEVLAVLKG